MHTQDRRVKRTQKLLAQALIALTLEKGYEAVTIRDITQRADEAAAFYPAGRALERIISNATRRSETPNPQRPPLPWAGR